MKIYVYKCNEDEGVYCLTTETGAYRDILLQSVEAEETILPITQIWQGEGIEIGEVFNCNTVVSNLIRTA
jgi:hypothetical protein